MLIPKKDRTKIFTYLFKEGVLVARKDVFHKHPTILVKNLHVVKLMQSLESRSYVKHSYNWGYNYYYLTNSGIDFLRATLYLPESIVPATLTARKRTAAPEGTERRSFRRDGEGEQRGGRGVRREGYYRSGEGAPAGRGRAPRTAAPVTAQ
jgi:small subunit ribosomal protein S10e